MPSAILLTSTHLRHQFVAARLASKVDLLGVWQEEKTFKPEKYAGSEDDLHVIHSHFEERDKAEARDFGNAATLTCPVNKIPGGSINEPENVEKMKALNPDVVLVYGTGILKEGIIDAFSGNILNIHLGLSPYYRGSGTNFWPLVNREPEYVGATIHYLDAGIDTGPILCHVRPKMHAEDGPHDIGNKVIIAAADALANAAELHAQGKITGVPQEGDGKLYQRKDFNADAVREMRENFEAGMIKDYLDEKQSRDQKLSLVSLPTHE